MIFQRNVQHKKNTYRFFFLALLFLMHSSCVQTNSWRDWIPTTLDQKTVTYGAVGLALLYLGIQLLSGPESSSGSHGRRNGGGFGRSIDRCSYSSQRTGDSGSNLSEQLAMAVVTAVVGAGAHSVFSKQNGGITWSRESEFACTINESPDDLVGLSSEMKALAYRVEQADPDLPPMLLFHGKTGTGKTFLAKVLAKTRGGIPLELHFSQTESSFTGVGVQVVSRLFDEVIRLAQETDGNITVIIDEIEGHLPLRGKLEGGSVANDQMKRVNAFIVGIDRINNAGLRGRVLLIGTTNHVKKIDSTLSNRPNRCKTFEVSYPKQVSQRRDLLHHYFKKSCSENNISLPSEKKILALAKESDGSTADHLRNYACESVNKAVRQNEKYVTDVIIDSKVNELKEKQAKQKAKESGVPVWVPISNDTHDQITDLGGSTAVCNSFNVFSGAVGNVISGVTHVKDFCNWWKSDPKTSSNNNSQSQQSSG